ncbi:hypothetical protein [Campylobacter sp.]|uniref:hypothetical protein n=1 Tax=Campylobacter sp. TaxID=205 RepID=UPI002AA5E985|nr:hypothetical protein [Campylobacter sp.]MCI7447724.1 hypothetical protein [Campylobacter sp.]
MIKVALFCACCVFCFCGEISIKSHSFNGGGYYGSKFDEPNEPKYNSSNPPRFDENWQNYKKGSYEHDKKRELSDLYGDYPSTKLR